MSPFILIHFYFNCLKLIYSILYRHASKDRGFVLIEVIGVIVLFIIYFIADPFVRPWFKPMANHIVSIYSIIYYFLYGLLFIGPSILARIIYPSTSDETVYSAANINVEQSQKLKTTAGGIIDIVWVGIMGAVYTALLFIQEMDIINNRVENAKSDSYYQIYFDEARYLLEESINVILILGTTLTVCMSILWAGAIWRDKHALDGYIGTTKASIKMVIAFFTITIGILVWASYPIYVTMDIIKRLIS